MVYSWPSTFPDSSFCNPKSLWVTLMCICTCTCTYVQLCGHTWRKQSIHWAAEEQHTSAGYTDPLHVPPVFIFSCFVLLCRPSFTCSSLMLFWAYLVSGQIHLQCPGIGVRTSEGPNVCFFRLLILYFFFILSIWHAL